MDSWRLTSNLWGVASPGPTSFELGSYCIADQGIEFDAGALFQNTYVENVARDGGQFAFSRSAIRKFQFPLRLASSWPGPNGLTGLEEFLRRMVRSPKGAFIDLLPQGAEFGGNPSSAVRFDILDGRLLPIYNTYFQRVGRRDATLELDVQPFGYLPTMIVLATAAAATAPFTMALNPASIIGDVPGPAEIMFRASQISTYVIENASYGSVSWSRDAFWWSLAGASGATALLSPSVFVAGTTQNFSASFGVLAGTHAADPAAPLGVALHVTHSPSTMQWMQIAVHQMNSTYMTPYTGRFRLFAYLRQAGPSYGMPYQITADEAGGGIPFNGALTRMASAYPVATLLPGMVATTNSGLPSIWPESPSGMYQILDLGEHAWPPVPSGLGVADWFLRLWALPATTNQNVASPGLRLGGLYALPLETSAGICGRGLIVPTYYNVMASDSGGAFQSHTIPLQTVLDGVNGRYAGVLGVTAGGAILPTYASVVVDLRQFHTAAAPRLATSVKLDIGVGGRMFGQARATEQSLVHSNAFQVSAALRYRPTFSFLRGI